MNIDRRYALDSVAFDNEQFKREYSVKCASIVTPSYAGDKYHDYVTQNRHVWEKYSSCGDLWNFVPWMMGCVDPTIVNRDDLSVGLKWHVQQNISRTKNGADKYGAWVKYKKLNGIENIPQPGDLMFIGTYPNQQEHVFVVESVDFNEQGKQVIKSFDYGQFDQGKKCGLRITRESRNGKLYSPSGKSRDIIGWIDISKLPLNRNAVDLDTFK